MEKKLTAIVLGGTSAHIAVIQNLKARGYQVLLLDFLDNPPAKIYADEHIQESTLDPEAVLKVARDRKADLVISACVDQANISACYAMEGLGYFSPYSYKTAVEICNKGYMKKVMKENGIPTSDFIYLDSGEPLERMPLRYPVMVKPADCNSASGVKKASCEAELKRYLAEAISFSRNRRAVVEEFVSGVELSAYCFVENQKANVIMTAQRFSVMEGEGQVLKCYATLAPAPISEVANARIQQAATDVARAFKLNNTPLHIQVFVNGDEISVIEFAPRVGGGISYKTIRDNTGFDIIDATIDSYLNIPVHVHEVKAERLCVIHLIYARPAVFDRIEGQDALLAENVIDGLYFHKTKGMRVGAEKAASARIGAFVVTGESIQEIKAKTRRAMAALEVYSDQNEKIMRKDLSFAKDLEE